MKKKIGTVLDEDLIYKAKQVALSQRKSLNTVLEDALAVYFKSIEDSGRGKEKNIVSSTKGAMRTEKPVLKRILEEEGLYET